MDSGGEGRNQGVSILDAKEVVFNDIGVSCLITNKALVINEFGIFVLLKPSRFRTIAKLLTVRCTPDMQKYIAKKRGRFWTAKRVGKLFLLKIKALKTNAIKIKFKVFGNRKKSRQKKERAQQTIADVIDVPLPRVGEHPGISATMMYEQHQSKTYVSIRLDGKAIDHIAHMANEFFSAAVHGGVDNSVDHDSPASDPADNDENEA